MRAVIDFELPDTVKELVEARAKLRHRYAACGLDFTFDGKLVGDLGEAIAEEVFDIELHRNSRRGIDGHWRHGDKRSVQIKASNSGFGPAFRRIQQEEAVHLIFFSLNFDTRLGRIDYNGPENVVREKLEFIRPDWIGQKSLTRLQICTLDETVNPSQRLPASSNLARLKSGSFTYPKRKAVRFIPARA